MTQHAIQMVQRNLTPGGDKNGADINLALDALEMAFTRNHINAFVIVGGDSDFIALVEKLKQYDKKVLVVGGRAFTSAILQKNCHEFIAYENLIAPQAGPRKQTERASRKNRREMPRRRWQAANRWNNLTPYPSLQPHRSLQLQCRRKKAFVPSRRRFRSRILHRTGRCT